MVELKIQYYLILQTKINLYVKYTNKDIYLEVSATETMESEDLSLT